MQAILHNIRSIYNVGSIFRTADGLGVDKLYLTGYTPEPIDRFGRKRKKFSKVALGAEEAIEWERNDEITDLIQDLKSQNTTIIACEPTESAQPIGEIDTIEAQNTCLIFGNEVDGLNQKVLNVSDQVIKVPMQGKKSSLNVAVSFGIMCHFLIDNIH